MVGGGGDCEGCVAVVGGGGDCEGCVTGGGWGWLCCWSLQK